mmetsp:Transcript_40048/g.115439  ORF Transcript_40048/g.115439 Transcript_40048/m.115439 type:complete len:339 (-) Transcript_40048:470-1486(-)
MAHEGQARQCGCSPKGVLQQAPVLVRVADPSGEGLLGTALLQVAVPGGLQESEAPQGLQRSLGNVDIGFLDELPRLDLQQALHGPVEHVQLPRLRVRRERHDEVADGRDTLLAPSRLRRRPQRLAEEPQEGAQHLGQQLQLARRKGLASQLGDDIQPSLDHALTVRRCGHGLRNHPDARQVAQCPDGGPLALAAPPIEAALCEQLHAAAAAQDLRLRVAALRQRGDGPDAGVGEARAAGAQRPGASKRVEEQRRAVPLDEQGAQPGVLAYDGVQRGAAGILEIHVVAALRQQLEQKVEDGCRLGPAPVLLQQIRDTPDNECDDAVRQVCSVAACAASQ